MIPGLAILAFVTLQRLFELWLSRRNTRRLVARGGVERGASHYPLIVAVHVLWLAALWWLAPGRPIALAWLALFILAEAARIWVFAALRDRWTTRIILVPGETLVKRGPYRFADHPNYLVVVAEILIVPMIFALWQVALIFSLLNAAVLAIRIREENRVLGR